MIRHELEENELVDGFFRLERQSSEILVEFLVSNLVHPALYAEFGEQVIKNLVGLTYKYFEGLDGQKKRHFLKILVKLVLLGFSMKRWEFNLSREDALTVYEQAPLFFTHVTDLTEPLESIRRELAAIDPLLPLKRLLLVEGPSELKFVETIQLHHPQLMNFEFDVASFDGKGNINNLVHLIREKNHQGVRVCLSYDMDRGSRSLEHRLKKQCDVEAFFAFQRDFESAFPPTLLVNAVNRYIEIYTKLETRIDEKTVKELLTKKMSFVEALSRFLGTDINKPKLGPILGEVTLADGALWQEAVNEDLLKTEIAKFLRFITLW